MTPSPKINSQVIFKASEMVTKSWTSCHNVSFMIFIIILPLLFHNYEKARNGVYHVKRFWQANSLFHTVFKQLYLKKIYQNWLLLAATLYENEINTRGATSKHKIGIFAHAYWDCHYFVIDCDLVCVIVIKRKNT